MGQLSSKQDKKHPENFILRKRMQRGMGTPGGAAGAAVGTEAWGGSHTRKRAGRGLREALKGEARVENSKRKKEEFVENARRKEKEEEEEEEADKNEAMPAADEAMPPADTDVQ